MAQAQKSSGTAPLTVSVGVHCHPGKVREENQDRISRFATPLGDFFLVADGVGGNRGGAEASSMIAKGYAQYLAPVLADAEPMAALSAVSNQINAEIYAAGHSGNPQLQNMGSTVAFALLGGDSALIGHVGDSRVYHIRDGRLAQVTHDHSAVQNLLDHGLVTETQARNHPDASVLTRSFGQKPQVEVEFDSVSLQAGDALLLCSDGLWGCVSDEEIAAVVTSPSLSVQACADALLDLALKAGGPDNISIEYLRFNGDAANSNSTQADTSKPVRIAAIVLGGVVALAAAVYGGWELSAVSHRRGAIPPTGQPPHSTPVTNRTPSTPAQNSTPNSGPSVQPATTSSSHTPSANPGTETQSPAAQPSEPNDGGSVPPGAPTPSQHVQYSAHVGVLLPKSRSIDWIVILNRVAGARVQPIQDTSHQCATQAQDRPIVYYARAHKQVASVIGVAWSAETTLKEMAPGVQNACGHYDVIVLPAKHDL